MRTQAIEKVLRLIVDECRSGEDDYYRIETLCAKAEILLNRDDNRAASVIRELMNERV